MLYVYIINIFIYSGTRSVLGSVPGFGYFGYKNIGTVRIFEGISPVSVSGILVRFRFGSSVPVILPRPSNNDCTDDVDVFQIFYALFVLLIFCHLLSILQNKCMMDGSH